MNKEKILQQISEKEKQIKVLKEQLKEEEEKNIWLKIPENNIMISTKLMFLGKTYGDILKEVNEDEIADYNLLQELRNEGKKSNWEKYYFLESFSAFVPNHDEVSKANGYVAVFYADSDYAYLYCGRDSDVSDSSRGVFLIKKISNLNKKKGGVNK